MDWVQEEQALTEQAQALIERGLHLHNSMGSLPELEAWDGAVNRLLERINADLSTGCLASRRLKRLLEQLIHLYSQVLTSISELEADKASEAADLHQARRAING